MLSCLNCCKTIPKNDFQLSYVIEEKYELDEKITQILDSEPTLSC